MISTMLWLGSISNRSRMPGEVSDRGQLATDQLLNAVYLVTRGEIPQGEQREALLKQLLKPLSSSEDT